MAKTFSPKAYAGAFSGWPAGSERRVRGALNREMGLLVGFIRKTYFRRSGMRRSSVVISRTGALERSVATVRAKRVRAGVLEAGVQMGGPSAPHAPFIEFGTQGPYVIVPRTKRVLRFVLNDGTVVFTRKVVHPGVRARAPLGRGVARRQLGISQRLDKSFGAQLAQTFG